MVARQHALDDVHAHLGAGLPDDLASPRAHQAPDMDDEDPGIEAHVLEEVLALLGLETQDLTQKLHGLVHHLSQGLTNTGLLPVNGVDKTGQVAAQNQASGGVPSAMACVLPR